MGETHVFQKNPVISQQHAKENVLYIVQLEAKIDRLEQQLDHIAENAESWHAGEDGKEKALEVIADWARGGPLYQRYLKALCK